MNVKPVFPPSIHKHSTHSRVLCRIRALLLLILLPATSALAQAPVVDDSENFALLDAVSPPTAAHFTLEEEQPLAKDDAITSNSENTLTLHSKVHALQQELQELRGQIEIQARTIKQLQDQQLAFYKDLDARIQQDTAPTKLEANAQPIPTPQPEPTGPKSTSASLKTPSTDLASRNATDEQLNYLAAYELVKNRQFDDALIAMRTFVEQYPSSAYAANAQYWLGELCLSKKDYLQAIEHFDVVLKQFPSSTKSSASLLKLAYALVETGNIHQAKEHLQSVISQYPDSNTAYLAAEKLQSIASM